MIVNRLKFVLFFKPRPIRWALSKQTLRANTTVVTSEAPPTRNPLKRMARYIQNDPFARVSLMFGGTVLVVLLVIEAFIPKQPKKVRPQVAVLPPSIGHPTIPREREMSRLLSSRPFSFGFRPSVVVVTGPSGSGKTNLVSQFVAQFASASAPRLSRKESLKPIVVYLDASNTFLFEQSIRYAARCLGLKSSELRSSVDSKNGLETVFAKLSEQKAKWLLIVDGVNDPGTGFLIRDVLDGLVIGNRKFRKGYVLITSCNDSSLGDLRASNRLSLESGLSPSEANQLFHKLAGTTPTDPTNEQIDELAAYLNYSPFFLSLASLTARLYRSFYESSRGSCNQEQLIADYRDMLKESRDRHVISRLTQLYVEALCAADNYFVHSIDFVSSCDLNHLLPSSVVSSHLKNSFYRLPSAPSASPLEDTPTSVVTPPSYFSLIKSKLPFMGGDNQGVSSTGNILDAPPGRRNIFLSSLFSSPFVQTVSRYNMDLISIHGLCQDSLRDHFLKYTVPRMEEDHLNLSRTHWEDTAWFKKFRTFDPSSALLQFRSSLPGLREGNVLNEEQFNSIPSPPFATYFEYIHMVSHNHRAVNSLTSELKYLSRDTEDLAMRSYVKPHLSSIMSSCQLAKRDSLKCRASLLSIDSAVDKIDCSKEYNLLLEEMKESFGPGHFELANIMTSLAEIHYYAGEYLRARDLLLEALKIQEGVPERERTSTHSLDIATSMSLLGLVHSGLGNKKDCKETLEKALVLFQTIPSDGDVPKKQRKLVSTTVTDLGHAYLFTGDVIGAKRYLDLAIVAQRNIYGEDHQEVARTLNVLSIVYSLLGDNVESRSYRKEAGKIEVELRTQSDVL